MTTTAAKEAANLPAERLSRYERETIINFNQAETMAEIFTYERGWQKHLERVLHLKPTMDNGMGGRAYLIPKDRIPLPRAKRVLSAEQRTAMVDRLAKARAKAPALPGFGPTSH